MKKYLLLIFLAINCASIFPSNNKELFFTLIHPISKTKRAFIDFYLPKEIDQEKKDLIKSCINKCMINVNQKAVLKGRGIQSEYCVHRGLSQLEKKDFDYEAKRLSLMKLTGIRRVCSPICESTYRLSLEGTDQVANTFEQGIFRTATGIDLFKKSEVNLERLTIALALARALLHQNDDILCSKYYHALYYLLPMCNPNENLQKFVYARIDTWQLKKKKWKLGAYESVPSLLHICMLTTNCIDHDKSLDLSKKCIIQPRKEIQKLLDMGAKTSTENKQGKTPFDLLQYRLKLFKKNPQYKDYTLKDSDTLKSLKPPDFLLTTLPIRPSHPSPEPVKFWEIFDLPAYSAPSATK